jgi:hypothetical protein
LPKIGSQVGLDGCEGPHGGRVAVAAGVGVADHSCPPVGVIHPNLDHTQRDQLGHDLSDRLPAHAGRFGQVVDPRVDLGWQDPKQLTGTVRFRPLSSWLGYLGLRWTRRQVAGSRAAARAILMPSPIRNGSSPLVRARAVLRWALWASQGSPTA